MISLSLRPPLYNLVPHPENAMVVMPPLWPDNLHKCLNAPSDWLTSSIVFFHVPEDETNSLLHLRLPSNRSRTQTCFPPIYKEISFYWKLRFLKSIQYPYKPSIWGSISTTNSKIKLGCYTDKTIQFQMFIQSNLKWRVHWVATYLQRQLLVGLSWQLGRMLGALPGTLSNPYQDGPY